jgi:hypothetical protein
MIQSRLGTCLFTSMLVTGALVTGPAGPASGVGAQCPAAFPTDQAVDGVVGTGWTVERGTTPDPFTATVLGRVTDGIAPGIDMIMADLSSPALTRAGGVWAGMSGSPVYAPDGRLIGSVSYGLVASSRIAGLTPAEDLRTLLDSPEVAASRVRIDARAARRVAATAEAGADTADNGFVQLKVPVSVTGAAKFSPKFLKHLNARPGLSVHTGGARISATATSSPAEISAGGNFVAALAYGDVSVSGIGTTTFVCDGEAVAFGHPIHGRGDVQYTVHPATAVFIQPDPKDGPFKVANPGGPVGVIDRDRTVGLHARLGQEATTSFDVTTALASAARPDAGEVTGSTTGVYQPYAADIAALHLQASIAKALGADSGGTAALSYTIKGVDGEGEPWSLSRSDHFTDADSISYTAADDLYNVMFQLVNQDFEDIRITGVQITGTVDPVIRRYRVTGLSMPSNGRWVPQKGPIVARPGATVSRLLTLTRYRSRATIGRVIKVKVPTGTSGDTGALAVSSGLNANLTQTDPTSFAELVKHLAEYPTNDSIAGSLALDGTRTVNTVTFRRLDAVVSDYYKELEMRVR